MGTIYASAKLTIVATDGDANHGIPGLKGVSRPRGLSQTKFPLGESDQVVIRQNPGFSHSTNPNPLFCTGLDYNLSKRRLIIGNNQFHWDCSVETHHEDMHGPDGRDVTTEFPRILSGKPDFVELSLLIQEYNSRELTFPEDALAGISGLLAIVSRSFDGGFIYGLAETCFDSALMWTVMVFPMQRRIHSGKVHAILQGSKLPSWSWLGWKGYLNSYEEYSGELYWSCFNPITIRITQWYSQETPSSSTKYAIRSNFLDHDGDFFKNNQQESLLTEGWTKERFNLLKHVLQGEDEEDENPFYVLGDYVYKHPSLPCQHYWGPFPIQDVSGNSSRGMPLPEWPFLSCDTKRGMFAAKRSFSEEYNFDLPGAQVSILGEDRACCGYLQVPSDEHADEFPDKDEDWGRTIELVAICIQRMIEERDDVKVVEFPQFRDWYGVLWVEWVDGVAYRKGVGRIQKESWESHDLEDIHLVLG
ncbi:hypothetical protein PG993_013153 [Apiospora rasikravindrae]|uniref:Uncharacterized protein n=1 Tax=Apiospora rasikravindrae TaxID=990691 RepID=A0ABR1RYE4_9PEZI